MSVPPTKLHTMTWFSCMTRWQFPFSRYNNSIDGHSQFFVPDKIMTRFLETCSGQD
jgi:hypothetical protein